MAGVEEIATKAMGRKMMIGIMTKVLMKKKTIMRKAQVPAIAKMTKRISTRTRIMTGARNMAKRTRMSITSLSRGGAVARTTRKTITAVAAARRDGLIPSTRTTRDAIAAGSRGRIATIQEGTPARVDVLRTGAAPSETEVTPPIDAAHRATAIPSAVEDPIRPQTARRHRDPAAEATIAVTAGAGRAVRGKQKHAITE